MRLDTGEVRMARGRADYTNIFCPTSLLDSLVLFDSRLAEVSGYCSVRGTGGNRVPKHDLLSKVLEVR